jgi:hemerythrin-like domain-containing protein
VDLRFLDDTVDFIRTYADRTHHGKEEDILFDTLKDKKLSQADLDQMNELIQDHVYARDIVARLVEARNIYAEKGTAVDNILDRLEELIAFYPAHIEKEDKIFFPAAMEYLSADGQKGMLSEFDEFDREMIHEKYTQRIQHLNNRPRHREVLA